MAGLLLKTWSPLASGAGGDGDTSRVGVAIGNYSHAVGGGIGTVGQNEVDPGGGGNVSPMAVSNEDEDDHPEAGPAPAPIASNGGPAASAVLPAENGNLQDHHHPHPPGHHLFKSTPPLPLMMRRSRSRDGVALPPSSNSAAAASGNSNATTAATTAEGGKILSLRLGDLVCVTQETKDWYLGRNVCNSETGIFPKSHVRLKKARSCNGGDNNGLGGGCSRSSASPAASSTSSGSSSSAASVGGGCGVVMEADSAMAEEILWTLRNWRPLWRELFATGKTQEFVKVQKLMEQLIFMRRQLHVGVLTQDQTRTLKLRIAEAIDAGNKRLGLELVPREENGDQADHRVAGPVHLYNLFAATAENRPIAQFPMSSSSSSSYLRNAAGCHIAVTLSDFQAPKADEDVEIYVSLFHRGSNIASSFLSERGGLNFPNQSTVIFMNIDNLNLCANLYAVYHVYKNNGYSRRPFAMGVVGPLSGLTTSEGSSREFESKVYLCENKDFHHLQDVVVAKSATSKSLCPNSRLSVAVQLLQGEQAAVRREHVNLFRNAIEARKIGFPNVIMPGDVRNDLYLTIEQGVFERGGKVRNVEVSAQVFLRQQNGVFGGGPSEGCFFLAAGLEGSSKAVFPVLYHANNPVWMETVRLQIPIEQFAGSHIRFEYRHCSAKDRSEKKLLGFSFVHLMEADETTIKDGSHSLCVYKCEDAEHLSGSDPKSHYLSLASRISDIKQSDFSVNTVHRGGFVRSNKESITIRTRLCSTKLTQNVYLMQLLNWKSNPSQIQETLKRIMLVEGEEIVKFLQDILDALFEMFTTEDGDSTGHSGLVFQVLVYIISSLEDPKFQHFAPVLDAYINEHFSAALVYKGLLTCLRHFTDHVSTKENQEPIQKCFASVEYLMKFIIRSRLLFIRTSVGQADNSFRDSVKMLFDSFNKMLSFSNENFQRTQIVFLRHVTSVYPHVLLILPVPEVAEFVTLMFGTLNRDLTPPVAEAMLCAVKQTVNSQIFQDVEARRQFLSTCCNIVKKYLLAGQHLSVCAEILGDMLTFFHLRRRRSSLTASTPSSSSPSPGTSKDIRVVSEILMTPLISAILGVGEDTTDNSVSSAADMSNAENERGPDVRGSLVSCLLSLLQQMDEGHYKHTWEGLNQQQQLQQTTGNAAGGLRTFLLECFLLFQVLITGNVFPAGWQLMRLKAGQVMLNAMQEMAKPLLIYFREERQFDRQLWMNYFTLGVTFLSQPDLQLERMGELARHRAVERFGDMRMKMAFQILSLWSHLGELKQNFIPGIIGPLLKMTLVPDVELRKSALPVFFDLLEFEHRNRGHFKQVECELVDKLDILVHENKADEDFKRLFDTMLSAILDEREPVWKESGRNFIGSVTTLLERLLDYRNALQAGESRDKQMSCIVNLLNFYKRGEDGNGDSRPNREEMFLRYVYKLHDLHLPAENFVEAAFTLKMHADLLGWTNRSLHADLRYPTQKEWERKEQLYLNVIDLLERGKHWEHAIPLTKELADVYERRVFNYRKLGDILRRQAALFEKIISTSEQALRLNPEYFRVGFYGRGFPQFLRNKEFVYRGLEFEKLPAFTQRISDEFPGAQVLPSNTQPDKSLRTREGQYVQICCVKPVPSPEDDSSCAAVEGYLIPAKIRKSRENMRVDRFQYDRPYHRGTKSAHNEFKTLWIERTLFQCASGAFPGILRWFQVTSSHVAHVPPVVHACETIESKNREIVQMLADPLDQPIQKLSLSLQGVIDAAVNGGIAKYQDAFFSAEFLRENPERGDDVARLQRMMLDQVHVLEQALAQHDRLISPEVRPLHDHLVVKWREMRESLQKQQPLMAMMRHPSTAVRRISRTASSRKGPLPPVPPQAAFSSSPSSASSSAAHARLSMTSMTMMASTASSSSDGIYSQPQSSAAASDVSSNSSTSANSLMTVSLTSLPPPPPATHNNAAMTSSSLSPLRHQNSSSGCFNVNDAYHQIDKFDYVDASPVSEEAVIDAANGGCPPYAGIAPPLPPRTGASPTGGGSRGPIVTSAADERIRATHLYQQHSFSRLSHPQQGHHHHHHYHHHHFAGGSTGSAGNGSGGNSGSSSLSSSSATPPPIPPKAAASASASSAASANMPLPPMQPPPQSSSSASSASSPSDANMNSIESQTSTKI